jgi:ABC-type multidrug transport system fused ATPase/permease subunit
MRFYLRAISYFRDDLSKIILSLALIGLLTIIGLLQAFPLAILIGMFVPGGQQSKWMFTAFHAIVHSENRITQIVALAVITLLLGVIKEIVQMYQKILDIIIGYNGLMRSRGDLYRKLQELSLGFHKSQPQGDAIYRLSWDTMGFQTILNVITGTLNNALKLVGIVVVMLGMSWRLTLVSLLIVPLLLWVIKSYAKILQSRSLEASAFESQVTTSMQRSVSSIGLVQAFGRESDEFQRFDATMRKSIAAKMRLHWQEVAFWFYLGLVFTLGSTLLMGYGGWLIFQGAITVPVFVIFVQYLGQLYDPLNRLSSSGSTLAGGIAGAQRVFEVLDLSPIIRDAPDSIHLPRQPRVLRFEKVEFEYRDGTPVLQEISFKIEPGQMVAFVGSSGVGKTTLLNLLPRFYDPTRGAMLLDDHDARKIKIADLRKHVALVLQDNIILPTTVAENIAYGRPDASDAQIQRAAELSGAAAFIDKLPQKYETEISESGANLSGGQKQRISIARALLTEAPIIVLDEPTSALDPTNEQMITETLRNLKRQRTIILVSHRLSTVADCDEIFVMDEGKIVEQGTHEELVALHGLYFKMAKHQMKLAEPSAV